MSRRASRSRSDRDFARADSDSVSSIRMVPGWRRRSPKTLVTSGRPGSPWMGRPSTSSEVMIAPWSFSGSAIHCSAAACHAAFERENAGRPAVAPCASPVRPAAARTPSTSAKAAR